MGNPFLAGMYVRIPFEAERLDGEFREYTIGKVQKIDEIANTVFVNLYSHTLEGQFVLDTKEYLIDRIERCFILPDTAFTCISTKKRGRILLPCTEKIESGQLIEYYVQIKGERQTTHLSEADLVVADNCQNHNPYNQLKHYEFHNPVWKFYRDEVIESYSQLRNATFGIEELVGSRIMLLAHQAEVVARVLSDAECRYILADEVGLGKTIEACVILKGLRRRDPSIKTLIIAPASLTQQWHGELNAKFWLDFKIIDSIQQVRPNFDGPGAIVSTEVLSESNDLRTHLNKEKWGLLILDEAHHLRNSPKLYKYIYQLSEIAKRVLILSATPIQRRADEYLDLLALMDPSRYKPEDSVMFKTILASQDKIRRAIAYLSSSLTPSKFDPEEFEEEIEGVVHALQHDPILANLAAKVSEQVKSYDRGLLAAKEALSYVSENYRIESRVIRNRRVNLTIDLPLRQLDTSYSYVPSEEEASSLDNLYVYIEQYTEEIGSNSIVAEYCRVLLNAAYSSPHALLHLLEMRSSQLKTQVSSQVDLSKSSTLLTPAAPRLESERVTQLIKLTPRLFQEDNQYLDNLIWLVKRWKEQTDLALSKIRRFNVKQVDSNYRLLQVIRAIDTTLEQGSDSKVLVFSAWLQTIETLLPHILRIYGKASVAQFTCRLPIEELQNQADIFQGDNNCQILLCDELGGEGRNFQIANSIVHVDLPWTPTQLEQRIGRVDRLGRKGSVLSIVPFAKDWSEQDLFMIWQEAFQLFTQSMSGLEIALEGIQHELVEALWRSPRHGLAELLTDMIGRAAKLREDVEEERYFDEVAINYNRRAGFQEISQKYRDGKMLRKSFMGWANLIGLSHSYDQKTDTLWFNPKKFSRASMTNAKLLRLPDMQEALRRSGRHHDLKIKGTFNRDIAIRREDLVFFAPGNDPWTDAIVANAIQADSGRCCAVGRVVPELTKDWEGFELFYSFAINPRPLYEAGYDPIHLFRALGFLRKPTYRLLISKDGEIIARSSPIWRYIKDFDKRTDLHLGKRDGTEAQIFAFKTNHPPEEWHSTLTQIFKIAEGALNEELDFMTEMAEEARVEFERHAIGWMAANRWRYGGVENTQVLKEIRDYEIASAALVEGINHPLCQLESVCYWVLNHKADK